MGDHFHAYRFILKRFSVFMKLIAYESLVQFDSFIDRLICTAIDRCRFGGMIC